MGFIIAYDNNVIEKENLPQELGFCKNYVDFNSKNFVDYMVANIETVIEKTPQEVAKIETRKVEKVEPLKKEYVDMDALENAIYNKEIDATAVMPAKETKIITTLRILKKKKGE